MFDLYGQGDEGYGGSSSGLQAIYQGWEMLYFFHVLD